MSELSLAATVPFDDMWSAKVGMWQLSFYSYPARFSVNISGVNRSCVKTSSNMYEQYYTQ